MLKHPAIISVIGLSKTDFHGREKPVLILKFMENGSLKKLISKKDSRLTDTNKLIIMYGISSAMSFLHSNEIIHRDLKLENILIDEKFQPQICDFGFSKSLKSVSFDHSRYSGANFVSEPEVFDSEYLKESDVFSFAMIVYELITGNKPFKNLSNNDKIPDEIKKGNRPEFTDNIPDAYKQLIERCWSNDLHKRPSFNDIVDELENNQGFITESIDVDKYLKYIQFIKNSPKKFLSNGNNNALNSRKTDIDLNEQRELFKHDVNFCKKAADENNDPIYMFYYAVLAYNGDGIDKDDQTAAFYFKKSADKGVIGAMFNYGIFLQNGIGCKKNIDEAIKYYKMAADKEFPCALFNYGMIMFEKDKKVGASFIKKAADYGLIEAKFNYGMLLFNGDGVEMNKEEACRYLEEAADDDQIDALHNYGLILLKGDGIPKNKKKGYEYLKRFKVLRDDK